jgi:hypothetical protein
MRIRLNDPLITEFKYEGTEFQIDLAYDNVLDVFDVLADNNLIEQEKAEICLKLLLDEQVYEPTIDLWNYIFENFIKVEDKKPIQRDLEGNILPPKKDENFINLDKDAEYIYSSFKQAYGIDLYEEQGKMHWNKFQALLNGLPSDTKMQEVIQIRRWKPSKGDTMQQKSIMRELQEIYSLEDVEEEESL